MNINTFRDIQLMLADDLDTLNGRIADALHSPNVLMNRVIGNYLEKRGKQIRPILVLLCARLIGAVNSKVISGAVAVELLHNASLIHDDVVDDATTRRGATTINGTWDNHLAVLVGDFFLSNALLQSVDTADIRIVESISNLGKLLSIGELDEIYNARYNELDEDTYFEIIFRKTASLFVSCVEVGVYGAGGTTGQLNVLREFARLLGLCFQIKDDVFDYFSDEKIGKPTGNDIREGKITLPLIHALANTEHPRHTYMVQLAKSASPDNSQVAELIDFAKECGGIDYAYDVMTRLRHKAVALLEAEFPESDERRALTTLFDFIINREN